MAGFVGVVFARAQKWRSTWHPFLEQKRTSEREREDKEIIKNVFCVSYRVNCAFYHKIGACRHGDQCSRLHNKPTFSQVVMCLLK